MTLRTLFLLGLFFLTACETQHQPWYLNALPASLDQKPLRFAEEVISTSNIEYNTSFSGHFPEFYYSKAAPDFSSRQIMVSHFKDGQFSAPQPVSIGGQFYDASDVQIAPDGSYLYFKMRGQIPNDPDRRDGNVWRSKREGNQWGKAEMLPQAVNSPTLSEYYPIVTHSGNLYFSRENPDTDYDIYVSEFVNGTFQEAQKLPSTINTNLLESDAYIAPDESFMVFVRMYADDGLGVSDLYISFNKNGQWTEAVNMKRYNSPGVDGSPFITKDGQFMFFTSTRDSENPEEFDGHLDLYVARFNAEDWR